MLCLFFSVVRVPFPGSEILVSKNKLLNRRAHGGSSTPFHGETIPRVS